MVQLSSQGGASTRSKCVSPDFLISAPSGFSFRIWCAGRCANTNGTVTCSLYSRSNSFPCATACRPSNRRSIPVFRHRLAILYAIRYEKIAPDQLRAMVLGTSEFAPHTATATCLRANRRSASRGQAVVWIARPGGLPTRDGGAENGSQVIRRGIPDLPHVTDTLLFMRRRRIGNLVDCDRRFSCSVSISLQRESMPPMDAGGEFRRIACRLEFCCGVEVLSVYSSRFDVSRLLRRDSRLLSAWREIPSNPAATP